ncbi:MAG: anti-sigma factor [Bacteroidota bacterium]
MAGALAPDETLEVERMAEQHPQVRAEIAAIEKVVQALMGSQERNPRPELRARILDGISGADEVATIHQLDTRPAPAPRPVGNRMRYLLAASLVFTVLSASAAGYFGYRWNQTSRELAAVMNEKDQIVGDRQLLKARLDRSSSDLALLRDTESRMVELKGLPIAADARARVYWNPRTSRVMFDKGSLPEPPAGHQYQLWAIAKNGPVDDGMVVKTADTTGFQKMKDVAAADAFAITLEPEGGSPTPTMDRMYVMGKL